MANPFARFKAVLDNRIANNTREIANRIVEEAVSNAPTTKIKEAIYVESVERTGRTVEATIVVNLTHAPEAAAYEYGSGIHKPGGKRYPITAVNQPAMVFYWEPPLGDLGTLVWNWKEEGRDAGEVVFHKPRVVMHPGVQARPYMTPAVRKALPELYSSSNGIFREEISFYFKQLTE